MRLVSPQGTVVDVNDDLGERMLGKKWKLAAEAVEPVEVVEPDSDEPAETVEPVEVARKPGRPARK